MFLFNDVTNRPPQSNKKIAQFDDSPMPASEWIEGFTSSHPWLCLVDEAYLKDNFNLYGLSSVIEDYHGCIKIVRGEYSDLNTTKSTQQIQKQCEDLYGLIHSRYLLTFAGVREMKKKYEAGTYGVCPRVACCQQKLLPVGLSPNIGEMSVKVFCPCCQDVYECDCKLDGAYFGPYFPHFFTQSLKDDLKINEGNPTVLTIAGIPVDPTGALGRSHCIHE